MHSVKVLVIDDKRVMGDLFHLTLQDECYKITYVQESNEAMCCLQAENFDIIFLDFIMPQKDGLEIFKEIKSLKPSVPVVLMSGFSVEEKRVEATQLGALTCLKKPFEMDTVKGLIKTVMEKDI